MVGGEGVGDESLYLTMCVSKVCMERGCSDSWTDLLMDDYMRG